MDSKTARQLFLIDIRMIMIDFALARTRAVIHVKSTDTDNYDAEYSDQFEAANAKLKAKFDEYERNISNG